MTLSVAKYKQEIDRLIKTGDLIRDDFMALATGKSPKEKEQKAGQIFLSSYQKWYTESMILIKQLLPDRLDEFKKLYEIDSKRKTVGPGTYTIQDYLLGVRSGVNAFKVKLFDDESAAFMRYRSQLEILRSIEVRLESKLFEIKALIQADVYDSEIDASRELLKKGFLRAAGAVGGVVLEKHLGSLCKNHNVAITKRDPTIGDLNDTLKQHSVIDVPQWRFIQRLGDLRNICVHNKDREPSKEECTELIDGVDKIMKTIF